MSRKTKQMLGLCCQWLKKDSKGRWKNSLVSSRYQYGRYQRGLYSDEDIKQLYIRNIECLLSHLPLIHDAGIRVFRMSSSMFSFHDKVCPSIFENEEILSLLKRCGNFIMSHKMRLTTHPDQFAVLSSDDNDIVENSVSIVNFHAWIFDQMKLPKTPYYSINVHGGKKDRIKNLIHGISRLSDSARSRLTLENCEYSYNVLQLEEVFFETGVPICFDSHHHRFNTGGLSGAEGLEVAVQTWGKEKPLSHLSNTKEDCIGSSKVKDLRKHSDYIYMAPEYQVEANNSGLIDVEIEAKMKQLAIDSAVKIGLNLN